MSGWNDQTSPGELKQALAEQRIADADALVELLLADLEETGRLLDEATALEVLRALKRSTLFERLLQVAEEIVRFGQNAPAVRCLLAQARIDLGQITLAIDGLLALQKEVEASRRKEDLDPIDRKALDKDLGETLGLLGRAYKQLYVNAVPTRTESREHDLDRALRHYGRAFEDRLGDYLWAGINRVALLTHAERVRAQNRSVASDEASEQARKILEAISRLERLGPWDYANRAEALLAMGRNPQAVEAVKEYLAQPDLDAFACQGTRRQLIELYGLNEAAPPGREILPMLEARIAELGAGGELIRLDPGRGDQLEKVWGDTKYQSLEWLRTALHRAAGIARLGPNAYVGSGTGFLFDGTWIGPAHAERKLLLTNAHVCTPDPVVQKQYPYPSPPDAMTAVFLGTSDGKPVEVGVKSSLSTSPPSDLDYTLLEIEEPPSGAKAPPRSSEPPSADGNGDRVNVVGHPKGLSVQVSLQDNRVVSVGDKYVHYRAPTDPGSSGSPVFNQEWQLVALHHASSAKKQANEGIRIERVIEKIIKDVA